MNSRLVRRSGSTRAAAFGVASLVAMVASVVLGLVALPSASAQTPQPMVPSPQLTVERAAEQALPRKIVSFDPTHFDRYVGYYQLGPTAIMTVTRDGSHFLAHLPGQVTVAWFPESETKFFATVVHAQISFNMDAAGRVTGLVLHQGGLEQYAPRIDAAGAKRIEAAIVQRIRDDKPSAGTEAALRNQIENMEKGRRDYSVLMPGLAAAAAEQWPVLEQNISSLGALKSIKFNAVSAQGWDIYDVTFERGSTVWQITPLTPNGKITGMFWRREP